MAFIVRDLNNIPSNHQLLTHYVTTYDNTEYPNKNGNYLGIGRFLSNNNLYIERFIYSNDSDDISTKKRVGYITINDGWLLVSRDKSIPLIKRYMDLIDEQCKLSRYIYQRLFPIIKGFISPLHQYTVESSPSTYYNSIDNVSMSKMTKMTITMV